eukprot:scaffold223467_cov49-Prasinocladus_malaysianus.AAC.5
MPPENVDVPYLWARVEPLLGYLPGGDAEEVRRALELAFMCHEGQMRKSGEPFITHPGLHELSQSLSSLDWQNNGKMV